MRDIGKTNAVQRQIGVATDFCARRNEIVFALHLHAVAGNIDGRDGPLPRRLNLLEKLLESRAESIGIEISRARYIKAGRAERLGDQACIVCGRRKRCAFIIIIADDEGITGLLLLLLRSGAAKQRGQKAHRGERDEEPPSEKTLHIHLQYHAKFLGTRL